MTELEIIRLRAKLHRLQLSDKAIKTILEDCEANLDTFETASQRIESWMPADPGSMVMQALACGLIAAVLGGTLARLSGI